MSNPIVFKGKLYGGNVDSVNTMTGAVTLNATNVGAIPASAKGTANGVATLDSDGRVPSTQLPAYVDQIDTYPSRDQFPDVGQEDRIYIDHEANKQYRWSGTDYVEMGTGGVALGETSATAYRGDRGKTAFDHSQIVSGNPHGTTKSDVGLANVDNTSDAGKPVSELQAGAISAAVANRPTSGSISGIEAVTTLPAVPDPTILYLVG